MNMPGNRTTKTAYYILAITFYMMFFFTYIGNYFHGGTPLELVTLQAIAVVISLMTIKLFSKVQLVEKIILVYCALLPLIFLISTFFSLLQ